MPARLVDDPSDSSDSSDSSDRDTPPASLRTTIRDLQRQLQDTQAQLTEARSSDDRFPPVTTPTSAPTPVSVQQPGPSNSGQDTDLQAMMASALQQMSGTTQPGPRQGESAMTPFLILGATLDPKIKAIIWAHQFIDLGSLTATTEPTLSWSFDPRSQLPLPHVTPGKVTPVTTMAHWLRAFSTYTSVYVERYPAEAPAMLTYMMRIMEMQKRHGGMAWRTYDENFRRIHALMPSLPWQTTNWDLAMDAVHGDATKTAQSSSQLPFRQHRQYTGPARPSLCFIWNNSGRCNNKQCSYKHACSVCGKSGHGKITCYSANKTSKKPPNSNPSPQAGNIPTRVRKG